MYIIYYILCVIPSIIFAISYIPYVIPSVLCI